MSLCYKCGWESDGLEHACVVEEYYRLEHMGTGWAIVDPCGILEHDAIIYHSEPEAKLALNAANVEYRRFDNAPACDAPHLDNF